MLYQAWMIYRPCAGGVMMPKAVDRREVMALREAGAQLVEVLASET